jgi:hypothetical protein
MLCQALSTLFTAPDSAVLADDVLYSDPLKGPLTKQELVECIAYLNFTANIPSLQLNLESFHIDPQQLDTVWCIARGTAVRRVNTPLYLGGKLVAPPSLTDTVYRGGPEAYSISIDSSGRVYRITAGYLVDATQGNTLSLGGAAGILEAVGAPLSWVETRSISQKFYFPLAPRKEAGVLTLPRPLVPLLVQRLPGLLPLPPRDLAP